MISRHKIKDEYTETTETQAKDQLNMESCMKLLILDGRI
jgi:hypothetical protein